MCDELTEKDNADYLRKNGITRRDFNLQSMGAALALMLPAVANAVDVVEQEVLVETPDGMADCYFVHPATGKHPAVIVWPDIMGIRTSFRMMGKRLAEAGYSVLVVNPYYRSVKGPVIEDGESFGTPEVREPLEAVLVHLDEPRRLRGHLRPPPAVRRAPRSPPRLPA